MMLLLGSAACTEADKNIDEQGNLSSQSVESDPIPNPMADSSPVKPVVTNEPDSIPGVNDFVLVEKEPVPINLNEIKSQIGYPIAAIDQEIEGKVILRILLDPEGNYRRHVVYSDSHSLLTQAVERVIPQLQCTPAISKGQATWYWITIPFLFDNGR